MAALLQCDPPPRLRNHSRARMNIHRRQADTSLITVPSADVAFREHVSKLARPRTPGEFEARLRRMFPRVVVRERMLSGEAPAWYVYRDGSWRSPLIGAGWDGVDLPRVVVSPDGWISDANATAMGILGIQTGEAMPHHFTDFIVPGTLEDSLALFQLIEQGHDLDATVLLRPTSGDVIAVDLHARRDGGVIRGVFRLADDVQAPSDGAGSVGPGQIDYVPSTDVAFRGYALRALGRMPEPTPDGLALRLRRLYPHAAVDVEGDHWVVRRDGIGTAEAGEAWWADEALPRVRYDAQALILEANPAAETFFGRALVGHHWQEFVTPGSTEQVAVMLEILAEVGAAESRFRMPRGDGWLVEFDSYTEARGEEFSTVFRPAGAPDREA
jgi:PAS domain-containing protein